MTSRLRHLTFDAHDHLAQARFWAEVLGFTDDPDDPNLPGDPVAAIVDPRGLHPGLLFQPVAEDKVVKNRLHLDVVPQGTTRDEEVARIVALGATVVGDHRTADGKGWVTLADPEGNEFCVERAASERADVAAPVDTGIRRQLPGRRDTGERELLEGMLEWYREGIVAKVDGLAQHHAVAQPLRSATSIAGLVKHLAMVDQDWFCVDVDGQPEVEPWAGIDWDADRDWEFTSALDEPFELQVERYREAWRRSNEAAARHHLDDLGAKEGRFPYTLRYVYLHMIEETARHLGHLDVLRELLDGTTGD